ncbi:UvrD-helicase domain-containing protein [Deinococcus fonticola]|uniref:UvrD-helicase domain-containing protein n=1 Tax=Deinococcus fonticola TaxID=2528713 RepID=UPI001074D6D5|nr:UvrD-helicase domain-containing protein [Deinococcus fonticola]
MTEQISRDRFTPEQAQAIHFPGSVAISAGAGNGKTRVLAERVVNLIDLGVSPASFAAVTSTEAAAAELRERILQYVERRTEENPGTWQSVLAELALMQVSTIHSLCGRIAREHPVESGAGLGFMVLTETEADAWLAEYLSRVLAELPMELVLAVPGRIRVEVIRTLLQDPKAARKALRVATQRASRANRRGSAPWRAGQRSVSAGTRRWRRSARMLESPVTSSRTTGRRPCGQQWLLALPGPNSRPSRACRRKSVQLAPASLSAVTCVLSERRKCSFVRLW